MKTFGEAEILINRLTASKEKQIEQILYAWLQNSRSSMAFCKTGDGYSVIDKSRARNHLRIVRLLSSVYNHLYLPVNELPSETPEAKSISPRYNAKVLRVYDSDLKKYRGKL